MQPFIACLLISGLLVARAAAAVDAPRTMAAAPRQFIIGMAGRWPSPADQRFARRWYQADSTVDAYVDVEELADPTWLAVEIDAYGRRAADCADLGPAWCRRELRRRDDAAVLFIAAGVHAELLWISDRNRAVRLGWRRVVETPTGTLTLDEPPADFAARLFDELPARLRPASAPDDDRDEVDRLVYYVDRALSSPCASPAERRVVERFVARNLARAARLTGVALAVADDATDPDRERLPLALADRLAAIRAWQAAARPLMTDARRWCPAWPSP